MKETTSLVTNLCSSAAWQEVDATTIDILRWSVTTMQVVIELTGERENDTDRQ